MPTISLTRLQKQKTACMLINCTRIAIDDVLLQIVRVSGIYCKGTFFKDNDIVSIKVNDYIYLLYLFNKQLDLFDS